MKVYIIKWTTGDTDRCVGYGDLLSLLDELGYVQDGNQVKDGDRVCGTIEEE